MSQAFQVIHKLIGTQKIFEKSTKANNKKEMLIKNRRNSSLKNLKLAESEKMTNKTVEKSEKEILSRK